MHLSAAVGDVGDDGSVPSLWSQLPKIVVVGGQSSGKSSVLESVVGKDFLPRGTDIVTKRPLVVTMKQLPAGEAEFGVFAHATPKGQGAKFYDFEEIRAEIDAETRRFLVRINQNRQGPEIVVHKSPMFLEIHSPDVPDLTVVDLPGTTTIPMKNQPQSIVADLENMALHYISDPNSIILAVTPANADVANSQALQLASKVDPSHQRTIGVLTKIDLMDKGTNAVDILNNRKYPLKLGWVGVVNRSQQDIDGNKTLNDAKSAEKLYFHSPESPYKNCQNVTTTVLSGTLSTELIRTIRNKLPSLTANIQSNISTLQGDLDALGDDMPEGRGGMVHAIIELCGRAQEQYKQIINHGRGGGERVLQVFEEQLPQAMNAQPFAQLLSIQSVKRIIQDSDGYQPFLVAPENGYRALVREGVKLMEQPAAMAVDAVDMVLRDIGQKVIQADEMKALQRFPGLQARILATVDAALDEYRKKSREFVTHLVKMEGSLVIPQLFKVAEEQFGMDKQNMGTDAEYGKVSERTRSYLLVVRQTLLNTVPKAIVFHQVKQAEEHLLDKLTASVAGFEEEQLSNLLGEDPHVAEQRKQIKSRVDMLRKAVHEISSFSG